MASEEPVNVLLVEDSPTDVLLTEEALGQSNRFRLRSSERLAEALRLLAEVHFDVVLLDLGLPDSDGLDTLRRLRLDNSKVAVIVLTGTDDEELALRALQEGAEDYLVKSQVREVMLGRSIRYAIERQRTEEVLHERAVLAALTANVGLAFTKGDALREMLRNCVESLVQHLDAAFARIWTLNEAENVLELQASAGLYTHLDGPHSRVPVGKYKIGLIAQEQKPHLTNDVVHDPRISDPEWAIKEGMLAFAGYPLLLEGQVVGVLAAFARHAFSGNVLQTLEVVANQVALGIERKRAEAERTRLLTRLQMQIHRMPLAYLFLDAECRIVDWNATAERIFGYKKEEMVGVGPPFEKFLPPAAWPAASKLLNRLQAGDMAAHAVNENLTRDGRTIICEWFNTPLLDDAGRFAGLISLAQDITERRHLEERYRQAQQRLRHVVVSSPAVLFTLGIAKGLIQGITWISDNLLEIFGYQPEVALGTNWWLENIHPDDREKTVALTHTELFRQSRLHQEYRFRHADGTYRWTGGELRLIRTASGEPVEVVGSWSDITESKRLEDQFRQAQKMEAVGQLAGGVAHDFNNLLTIINGYSELIQTQLPGDNPVRGLAREIGAAGERAASLTQQLLAFSRKQVLEPQVLNLNTIVTNTTKMLKRLIGEDVELNAVLAPELSQVKADRGQLEQLLINLVVNARDAMPQGGKLTIETTSAELDATYTQAFPNLRPGPYVLLAVTDTGVGMDEATKARIFEPFFTTKEPGKGTGLGLATVFGIVQQSEGHIAVYSEPEQGTTFKVYLPAVAELLDSGKSATGAGASLQGTETILFVEDEPALLALGSHILQRYGYKVLEASGGMQALSLAQQYQGPIHLLATDVVMPKMSGRQLAEQLMALRPGLKVLYLSGYTDDAVVRHGILQAEMAFLLKPFTPTALAKKIRDLLGG